VPIDLTHELAANCVCRQCFENFFVPFRTS